MPDDRLPISDLDEALELSDAAQFPYTQNNGGTLTTYKALLTQIAAKIVEDMSYAGINLPAGAGVKSVENTLNYLLDSVGGDPNGNISDSYDPTAAYIKGDLCIYENVLYICTAPTTGTFDPSKWTATTIDNVIGDLSSLETTDKSSVVGAVNEVNGKVGTLFKLGTFTKTYSVGANNSTNFDNSFITVPTGYKIGALLGSGTGNANCYFVNCRPSDSGAYAFFISNKSVSNLSDLTCTCYVLFVREDTIST